MNNQIATQNVMPPICPGLTAPQMQMIEAFNQPRLALYFNGKYEIKKLKSALIDIISKAAFNCGQSMSENDLRANYQVLLTNLKSDYKHLTVKEIELAFEKGSKGMYGDFYGLNQKTFYHWINAYLKDEERKIAAEKQLKFLEEINAKNKRLSEEEINAKNKKAIISLFENYHTDENFAGIAGEIKKMAIGNLYDKLKHHFIQEDEMVKQMVLKRISQQIENDKKDPFKRKNAKNLEEELQKNINTCMAFNNEYRFESVKNFFDYLKEKALLIENYL